MLKSSESNNRCLTQKEPAGEKEWIFLINRTEHPRLAERVRCLCAGCDVTWWPPCRGRVTQFSANRRRRAESKRQRQSNNSNTSNTAHNKFYVVRREAYVHGRSRESIFIGKKKITRSRSLFSLGKKRKSNLRRNRKLAAGDLTRVSENRTSSQG